MYGNKLLDTSPFKSAAGSAAITNKYQAIGSIKSRDTFYARPTDSALTNSIGNPFFVKANIGDVAPNRRAVFIPPPPRVSMDVSKPQTGLIIPSDNDIFRRNANNTSTRSNSKYDRWMYTGGDVQLYTFPLANPRNTLKKRGLFSALFGGFESPPTQNTTVTFNTKVSDTQRFSNEVQSFNQNIADYILNVSQEQVSDLSQLAEFNVLGLSTSSDLNLQINNTQNINFMNISKLDVKSVNDYVLNQSNTIVDQIMNNFQASSSTDLLLQNSSATNSNLLSSVLSLNPPKGVNMNTIINNNTNIETQFTYEKKAIFTNIAQNSTVNQFAQKMQAAIKNVFSVNLQNVDVTGKANIVVYNNQTIKSVVDIVTSLDLLTSVFKSIDTSNTFKVDRSVTATVANVTKAAQDSVAKTENAGDVVNALGMAGGNLLGAASSFYMMPLLLGGGALAIWYFMSNNNSSSSNTTTSPGDNAYANYDTNANYSNYDTGSNNVVESTGYNTTWNKT